MHQPTLVNGTYPNPAMPYIQAGSEVNRMSVYNQQATQALGDFVAGFQLDAVADSLSAGIARRFWEQMAGDIQKNIDSLNAATNQIAVLSAEAFEDFNDIFGFAVAALEWAREDEIAYIEALAEIPSLLLDKLKQAGYVVESIQQMAADWLRVDAYASARAYHTHPQVKGSYYINGTAAAYHPPSQCGEITSSRYTNPGPGRGL